MSIFCHHMSNAWFGTDSDVGDVTRHDIVGIVVRTW